MASPDVADALQQPSFIYILIVLAVLLVVYGVLTQLKGSKGDTVLLVGPCGAGKTTLLLQLEEGEVKNGTVASMEENISMVAPAAGKEGSARVVRVVDVPGHARIAHRILLEHVKRARGIVFLVDSVDFMGQKAMVAEQLYDVLSDPAVTRRRLPVLLAANKADCGAKAHTPDFIRKRLEKALGELRGTRASLAADETGAGAKQESVLSRAGEPFTFEGLAKAHGARLSVAAISAKEGDLEPVQQFIFGPAG